MSLVQSRQKWDILVTNVPSVVITNRLTLVTIITSTLVTNVTSQINFEQTKPHGRSVPSVGKLFIYAKSVFNSWKVVRLE